MRTWLAVGLAAGVMMAGSVRAIEKPEQIATSVFLGQAYPSGNVYLRPVPLPGPTQGEDDYQKTFPWPASISFQSLNSTHSFATRLRRASFSATLHDGQVDLGSNNFQLESAYIPALESMDETHEGCTRRFYRPKNPSFQYLSDDLFYSGLFNCNANEGIGVFRSEDLDNYSFSVVAFSDRVRLTDVKYGDGQRRPLTDQEAVAVAKEKDQSRADQTECSTTPAYLDSAILLVSGRVADSEYSIRISSYDTPGCNGHLATNYVLDIVKGAELIAVFRLIQPRGTI